MEIFVANVCSTIFSKRVDKDLSRLKGCLAIVPYMLAIFIKVRFITSVSCSIFQIT